MDKKSACILIVEPKPEGYELEAVMKSVQPFTTIARRGRPRSTWAPRK